MKKKFIITEVQAQKILNLSEATQQQSTSSSVDACSPWASTMAPSIVGLWTPGTIASGGSNFGDIDCCEILNGNLIGPYGGQANQSSLTTHCDISWSQEILGYGTYADGNLLLDPTVAATVPSYTGPSSMGWADCCSTDSTTGPCPNGTVSPGDSDWAYCNECMGMLPAPSLWPTITGVNCECCKDITTNSGDVPCKKCCKRKDGSIYGLAPQPGQPCECPKSDPEVPCKPVSTGDGCADVECENPNQVPNPSNRCECECPGGELRCPKGESWDADLCECVKKVVGPPLQTENRLRKRIIRGKLPQAPRRR
jgi:hypothetical protein|tara:strand:- start:3464 stop:4396 length:933 start_codon:yes stop_codon:yes gene_type:complete